MARIFSVRINLDEMFSRLDGLDAAEESAWLRGFRIGSRGKPLPAGASASTECGHSFGAEAYQAASRFSEQQSIRGKKSAANRGSTVVQPNLNRGSTISSNPVIHITSNPVNEVSSSVQPSIPIPTTDIMEGMDKDKIGIEVAKPMGPVKAKHLPDFLAMHGNIFVGREEREDWKSILAQWGWDACEDAARTLTSTGIKGAKIYRSDFVAWLTENYEQTEEEMAS